MRLTKSFKIGTYACTVQFILTDDISGTEKWLIKKHDIDLEDTGEAEGFTLSVSNTNYIVVLDSTLLSHNTAAHEIYHATQMIGRHRGIDDEESLAWLCGYITEQFYLFLGTDKVRKTIQKNESTEQIQGNNSGVCQS